MVERQGPGPEADTEIDGEAGMVVGESFQLPVGLLAAQGKCGEQGGEGEDGCGFHGEDGMASGEGRGNSGDLRWPFQTLK